MLCPSPLTLTSVSLRSTLVTVCQVTMQPVCGGMPRFKESAPQKLSLFTLPLRHAALCQGPRHHRHLASLRQHLTRSQRENLCAACSQSLLKTVHPEVINAYISHTIFSSLGVPNVCLNQGNVLLLLLGHSVAVSYLLVKKPRLFHIHYLKWSHIN